MDSRHAQNQQLLDNIHTHREALEAVLAAVDNQWVGEDLVYRFWHQSVKVYGLQDHTLRLVAALETIAPDGCELDPWFRTIVGEGTGQVFELSHNADWLTHTRPIVEAFFHARFMVAMAVRWGRELETAPTLLPSGWAALLELYGIR